jgi:hypothetical protein
MQFTATANTNYRFSSTHPSYATKTFNLNPVIFTSYNILLTRNNIDTPQLDLANIGIIYSPTTFYKTQVNNFTFTITSPSGVLTNYGFNLSTQCKQIGGASGVNAYGGTTTLTNFNLTCASNYDSVTLFYYYINSAGSYRNFTYIYGINLVGANATLAHTLDSKTYGMGLFERLLITTVVTLVLMGVVSTVGGIASGLAVGLIVLGYFSSTGFIPFSAIIITLVVGFILLIAWNTQR